MKVEVRNNNLDKALKSLKRKTKENLMQLKDRQYYTKPSTKRNTAKQAAAVRERKRQKNDTRKQF